MRLTRAGEYAIRCVLYLSQQERSATVSRRQVARCADIPFQFLGKIAQALTRAGILVTYQGSKGGYRLAVSPGAITLLDVIESVEGEIFLNSCLLEPESCGRSRVCPVHKVWVNAREGLRTTLASSTFADLVRESVHPGVHGRTKAPSGRGGRHLDSSTACD